ncbi:hypothetical protein GCM10018953_71610 [Streptosporangium nondiastaticum]
MEAGSAPWAAGDPWAAGGPCGSGAHGTGGRRSISAEVLNSAPIWDSSASWRAGSAARPVCSTAWSIARSSLASAARILRSDAPAARSARARLAARATRVSLRWASTSLAVRSLTSASPTRTSTRSGVIRQLIRERPVMRCRSIAMPRSHSQAATSGAESRKTASAGLRASMLDRTAVRQVSAHTATPSMPAEKFSLMLRRARTALVTTATSMNANSSSRSGPSKPRTSPEKRHMPWADTPVAMLAATMVRMSSAGRGATWVRRKRPVARRAARSAKQRRARTARASTQMTAVRTGWSEVKAVI